MNSTPNAKTRQQWEYKKDKDSKVVVDLKEISFKQPIYVELGCDNNYGSTKIKTIYLWNAEQYYLCLQL